MYEKSISVIHHINRTKEKNIISIDAKKVPKKIWLIYMVKTIRKLEIEGNTLNPMNGIYKKVLSQTKNLGAKCWNFPSEVEKDQKLPQSLLTVNIVLEVLATYIKQEK